MSSTVGVGAIPAGRGYPWARRGPRGGNRELPHEIGFDPGPQSRRKGWSPGESSASVRGPPPPPTTVRDPPIERRPSPALIKIRRKCPRGPSVGSAPAPSRRDPSTAGAGGARRSFGRDRRCGGVEAVRGCPSPPGPRTPSPRSASIRSRRTSRAARPALFLEADAQIRPIPELGGRVGAILARRFIKG